MNTKTIQSSLACVALVCLACAGAWAQPIISGPNMTAPTISLVTVDFDPAIEGWNLERHLIFDPSAGPMVKRFLSPIAPIPVQPGTAFPVWEVFHLDPASEPIADWHEEIHTAGWEWLIPSPGTPGLITKNGDPWPWSEIPMPGGADPAKLWVEFDPIPPIDPDTPTNEPNALDVHKRLVWQGPGPWLGNVIEVWEYPTPEPGTLALAVIGLFGGLSLARGRKRR